MSDEKSRYNDAAADAFAVVAMMAVAIVTVFFWLANQ